MELTADMQFNLFAFVYFTNQEGAATALQKMKRIKLGDRFLTVTPKTPKGKNKKQDSSPVESSTLHRVSSQSSVSSSDSSTPQSPSTSHHISGAACSSGDVSNGHTHTENNNDLTDGGCRGSLESNTGQQKGNRSNITDTSNSTYAFKKEGKLEKSETASCSPKAGTEKGSASLDDKLQAKISPNIKKSAPVHMLLTHVEMCELFKKFKKPLRTLHNIGAQKFDILVTDVVDSCHFWANIDDLVGNYMELVQIGADLQVVQHHDRCMPIKYQLGASLFSEDKKWYRCWCLEVSNLERREAKVFYIDYGNCEWISWNQFTGIHKKFWDLAPQAVPFKLAGLENATDLSPEVLNEGTEYLRALILDKVCKARITQSSDPNKPHIFEVELITKEDAIHVNKQMALTRYVQETREGPHVAQGPRQNHSIQECHQVPGSQQQVTMVHQQQPATQTPPGTSVNTQNAKVPQTAEHHVRWSVDQEILPSKQAEHSQQLSESSTANSLKNPVQSPQNMQVGQQSSPNQKMEPVEKSLPKTLQLPSYVYQLFDKKEVMDVSLSYVISPDEIYFFLADKKTRESLKGMAWALLNEAKPKAKIYPRVGDIVARVTEKNGEQKVYRVRIKSIPKTAAIGVDKVVVQNVDYGFIETVHLNSLCELPPSLKHLPPHAMQAKMAGIQKKASLVCYPEWATSKLLAVKTRRKVLQASVVKRQEGGVLLVELFESEGPSLNVQLLKMDGVQLDESQRPLICFSTSAGSDSSCLSQTSSNLPVTTDQNPRWHLQERRLDPHPIDVQSNHSDWEDCLIDVETDRMEATPVTGAHEGASERQSWDHLYMPPPPEMHSPSSAGSANTVPLGMHPTSAAAGITSHVPLDQHPPSSALASPSSSMPASSIPASIRPPFSGGSLNGLPHDRHPHSSASAPSGSSVPPDVGPPSSVGSMSSLPQHTHSPYSSGSESSDLNSHISSKGLSSAVQDLSVTETDSRTVLNGGEKILRDKKLDTENELAEQEDSRDWWQAKAELIQKDEELKRILDMPRSEMMKMISLRQEKEKLERKIRMKGLENQILKLQKELKQLELEKEELGGEIS